MGTWARAENRLAVQASCDWTHTIFTPMSTVTTLSSTNNHPILPSSSFLLYTIFLPWVFLSLLHAIFTRFLISINTFYFLQWLKPYSPYVRSTIKQPNPLNVTIHPECYYHINQYVTFSPSSISVNLFQSSFTLGFLIHLTKPTFTLSSTMTRSIVPSPCRVAISFNTPHADPYFSSTLTTFAMNSNIKLYLLLHPLIPLPVLKKVTVNWLTCIVVVDFLMYKSNHSSTLQGPALYAYNNAMFTPEDWKGIRMLCDSIKVTDPMKVGRFGLGFKSVFHMTGTSVLTVTSISSWG